MTVSTIPPITRSITINAPIDRAFKVFTDSFTTWWPAAYHIGEADYAEAVLETREGGRWYERGTDGSECDWGKVLAWDPPRRVVLGWQINGSWQYDPDNTSEIDVRFTAAGPSETLVELEHRHLERLADGKALHDAVSDANGWNGILKSFKEAAEA